MTDRSADEKPQSLDWQAGVPVSRRFEDPYYSLSDGLAETEHVFLHGNDLPSRWPSTVSFQIAELGFGTGLGFLAARRLWRQISPSDARLRFTSFEINPLTTDEMARALKPWPDLDAEDLLDHWPFEGRISVGDIQLEVIPGDARQTVPAWTEKADAWFLDGFAPAKNPELWGPALMQAVADHTAVNGTFATYTAAGHVRRALSVAGFDVTRREGFGRKRHMTTGRLNV
ncbi:MAG: tRNA (5-methylaminomethyl-2-thiouridine)(34)-methyltransferase MnmD [Pseudomonadota bacterium]